MLALSINTPRKSLSLSLSLSLRSFVEAGYGFFAAFNPHFSLFFPPQTPIFFFLLLSPRRPLSPRGWILFFSVPVSVSAMKLANIFPTKLFKPLKSRSVSRSETNPTSLRSQETSSFSSIATEDVDRKLVGVSTPTSVLLSGSADISSDEWSDVSSDVYLELKQAFEMIDRDGDGKIGREELEALLRVLGVDPPSQEELRLMLAEVDRDGDGCITLEEFHAVGSAFAAPACDSELRDTFDFFDSDRDGRITAEELLSVFAAMGDARCTLEDCRRIIRGVDRNGDGFVCFEDFSLMMDPQLR